MNEIGRIGLQMLEDIEPDSELGGDHTIESFSLESPYPKLV